MTSRAGLLAAILAIAAVPVALAAGIIAGAAEPAVHLTVGFAYVLLAVAMFDFDLPVWINRIGAAAAAAFGAIFLLQFVSDVFSNETLHSLAFQVFGQQIERWLPEFVFGWFIALLAFASTGRSRTVGAIVMTTVVALEISAILGSVGFNLPDFRLRILIPFVWLAFEAAKAAPVAIRSRSARSETIAGVATAS